MEFDKSKVYTALNADELKVGSKIIVADSIKNLRDRVEEGSWVADTLVTIGPVSCKDRFIVVESETYGFNLAYLISEPEEKKLEWTDLKIGDVIKHKTLGTIGMIVGINTNENDDYHIFAVDMWLDNTDLLLWEKVESTTKPRQRTYPTLSDDLYKDKVEPKPIVSDQSGVGN